MLMEMVGADWLKSDKREDDLGGRAGSIVQVLFQSPSCFLVWMLGDTLVFVKKLFKHCKFCPYQ